MKTVEEDPSMTPGSVARSPLSMASIKDSDFLSDSNKGSPGSAGQDNSVLTGLGLSSASPWSNLNSNTSSVYTRYIHHILFLSFIDNLTVLRFVFYKKDILLALSQSVSFFFLIHIRGSKALNTPYSVRKANILSYLYLAYPNAPYKNEKGKEEK